jgi:hypothetical protein
VIEIEIHEFYFSLFEGIRFIFTSLLMSENKETPPSTLGEIIRDRQETVGKLNNYWNELRETEHKIDVLRKLWDNIDLEIRGLQEHLTSCEDEGWYYFHHVI